jgi:hypothetical protein
MTRLPELAQNRWRFFFLPKFGAVSGGNVAQTSEFCKTMLLVLLMTGSQKYHPVV